MAPPEHVNGAPESEFELWLSQDFSQLNNFLASKPAPAPHDKLQETEPSASVRLTLPQPCPAANR
jgi:hypothetical protein